MIQDYPKIRHINIIMVIMLINTLCTSQGSHHDLQYIQIYSEAYIQLLEVRNVSEDDHCLKDDCCSKKDPYRSTVVKHLVVVQNLIELYPNKTNGSD